MVAGGRVGSGSSSHGGAVVSFHAGAGVSFHAGAGVSAHAGMPPLSLASLGATSTITSLPARMKSPSSAASIEAPRLSRFAIHTVRPPEATKRSSSPERRSASGKSP